MINIGANILFQVFPNLLNIMVKLSLMIAILLFGIEVMSNMFNYCKVILGKVSFDGRLFRKEYRKSLRLLNDDEAKALRSWVRHHRSMA